MMSTLFDQSVVKTANGDESFHVTVDTNTMEIGQIYESTTFTVFGSQFSIQFAFNLRGTNLMYLLTNKTDSGAIVRLEVEEDFHGYKERKFTVGPNRSHLIYSQELGDKLSPERLQGYPAQLLYRFNFHEVISFVLTPKFDAMNNKLIDLSSTVEYLKSKISKLEKRNPPSCTVCQDQLTTASKIAQCISGHLVCWSCKEGLDHNETYNCEVCGKPVNGRALGMEQHLRDNM